MSSKAPEAFRTISEVAGELDVPQHVLRFWESKFSAVRPLKRGGGRRYYRPADVDVLRGVKTLLYGEGYTIRGVQKVFRTQGVRYVADVGQTGGKTSLARETLAPAEAEEIAAVASAESKEPARAPAQLSLVEPTPIKLATVDRRRLQKNIDSLSKLRADLGTALAKRSRRLEPMPEVVAAKA